MLLTELEFRKLPMTYLFGLNHDAYCARKYVNEQFGICKEVVTKRNVAGDIYSGFQEPKVSYYMGNDGQIYDSAQELYEGEFLTHWFGSILLPVRDGLYETERGMVMFTTSGGWECEEEIEMWRGMVDVPERKPA